MTRLAILKWTGTAAGIAGALALASNTAISPWGFVLFLVNSGCWQAAALTMRDGPLWLLNVVYSAANLLGIFRWLT